MLSIDVAAVLSADTRPATPDTPGSAMAVVLAGITALARWRRRWQKAPNPGPVLSRLRRLCSSGGPRWFSPGSYVHRAGACPAARCPRGMGAVRAPLAKGVMAVLIVVTAWRCRSMSGFADGSADGSALCSEVL